MIALGARAKVQGDGFVGEHVELHLCNDDHVGEASAYERLLDDAMIGDQLLFAREDGVEQAWRVVDDVLHDHGPVIPYAKGTWGPDAQNLLVRRRAPVARPRPRGRPRPGPPCPTDWTEGAA